MTKPETKTYINNMPINNLSNMVKYTKPALTFKEQVKLLQDRGLQITNIDSVEGILSNISYYRLSAYMLPFKKRNTQGCVVDEFIEGTTWEKVYNLYKFDRKLRLLVFDAIERLEVSFRTQIIYQLSHKYGSHWQDNENIFKKEFKTKKDGTQKVLDPYTEIQKQIKEQLNSNNSEVFIKHYTEKYDSPTNPPSWMCVEILYFNQLSKICNGLKARADISGIALFYDLPPETFCSWLHSINYIRNICAHHSRLWNRDIKLTPKIFYRSKNKIWLSSTDDIRRNKIYYILCMINFLLQTVNPESNFKTRLFDLLDKYKDCVNLYAMGFPKEWRKEKMWSL